MEGNGREDKTECVREGKSDGTRGGKGKREGEGSVS